MAWQNPKVTWGTELVSDTDLNRIEGNTQHLYDNKLDKTATAADSSKLGGVLPAIYARQDQAPLFSGGYDGGAEGGEIHLKKAANSSLTGNTIIDMLTNALRIFESNPPFKGAYIDLASCAAGVATKIWHTQNMGHGTGLFADWASKLHFVDRRGTNPTPQQYYDAGKIGAHLSLFTDSSLGIPYADGSLFHVLTMAAWGDIIGGTIQLAVGVRGKIFMRTADPSVNANAWGAWINIFNTKTYGILKAVYGNYTLTDDDHGKVLINLNAGGKTVYAPAGLRYDFECSYIENHGAGSYTNFAPSGVGMYSVDSKRTTNKPGSLVYIRTSVDNTNIILCGDLRA